MSNTWNAEAASAFEDWQLCEDDSPRPVALIVEQRRRAFVLPYFRWISAEGDNSEVKITFASHRVTVTGNGLATLLVAIADQRVVRLILPTKNEASFGVRGAEPVHYKVSAITELLVEEFK